MSKEYLPHDPDYRPAVVGQVEPSVRPLAWVPRRNSDGYLSWEDTADNPGEPMFGSWAPWPVYEQAAIDVLREALRRLADAADTVGVRHFDSDDMPLSVQAMQSATQDARRLLDLCVRCGLPHGCPDCRAVHDVPQGA